MLATLSGPTRFLSIIQKRMNSSPHFAHLVINWLTRHSPLWALVPPTEWEVLVFLTMVSTAARLTILCLGDAKPRFLCWAAEGGRLGVPLLAGAALPVGTQSHGAQSEGWAFGAGPSRGTWSFWYLQKEVLFLFGSPASSCL